MTYPSECGSFGGVDLEVTADFVRAGYEARVGLHLADITRAGGQLSVGP